MKKINAIYALHTIDGFAGSLMGVFVPSYMYNLGYSLSEIFIYFITYSIVVLVIFFVAAFFSNKYGLRFLFLIRLPFLLAFLVLLYFLDQLQIPIFLLAILTAINAGFYWFALHVYFTQNSNHETMGSDTGKLQAFPKLFSIFAPLLGGLIAVNWGFKILFIVSFIIYLFSSTTLLFIENRKTAVRLNLKKLILNFKKYKKYFFVEVFKDFSDDAEGTIWPIFIFLSFKNFLTLGSLNTVIGLSAAIFYYVVGKISDRTSKRKILKLGAVLMILVWAGRFILHDIASVYILTILAGFFGVLITISFNSIFYGMAKKDANTEEFIIFSEFAVSLGRVALYSFCLLLVSKISLSFWLAAASYIAFFFF
jgi:MFS family permease